MTKAQAFAKAKRLARASGCSHAAFKLKAPRSPFEARLQERFGAWAVQQRHEDGPIPVDRIELSELYYVHP